ncbi:DUF2071 domain-containing protein [Halocatena pleomorpha]|uniref:DUF2071 domain-containing protein n=2 Tax=Halocatena pleomorpha TaxID=1785090 RepID=A0A3P3RND7_9EURY|nr:DUF2071 domain-containing protein [Halocatena pleomorpha]
MVSASFAFSWRRVVFINWPVEAELLASHLPGPFAVHTYDGTGWLTIVPFVNAETRPLGVPRRLGVDLPELNLRTYVVHDSDPGVYFFSLDAPSVLAVLGARFTHCLPYYYAQMSVDNGTNGIRFRSRRRHPGSRPASYDATYRPTGSSFTAGPDSLSGFLTDRHRLYTQSQNGDIRYTDIEHESWTLYDARVETTENALFQANGFDHPDTEPVCYYSPSIEVTTTPSKHWERTAQE